MQLTEQRRILNEVQVGDVFEHGKLFAGLCDEPVVWQVVAVKDVAVGTVVGREVRFHLFMLGVLWKIMVGTSYESGGVKWLEVESGKA